MSTHFILLNWTEQGIKAVQDSPKRLSAAMRLAKAAITMAKVDLWHARLAVKTLRRDQREAIAEAGED